MATATGCLCPRAGRDRFGPRPFMRRSLDSVNFRENCGTVSQTRPDLTHSEISMRRIGMTIIAKKRTQTVTKNTLRYVKIRWWLRETEKSDLPSPSPEPSLNFADTVSILNGQPSPSPSPAQPRKKRIFGQIPQDFISREVHWDTCCV
jgi:hypothetical protein